jgi:ABC-type amino acid transport substrate-binding protein
MSPQLFAVDTSLSWLTKEYPPYNFENKSKIEGIAVVQLRGTMKELGLKLTKENLSVLPWARGYSLAQEKGQKNVLFSTTRTKEIEDKFKWLGPIADTTISVFALAKSPSIKTKDLKNNMFCVVRDDIGEQLLKDNSVSDKNLMKVNKLEKLFKMVQAGRANYFAYEENIVNWNIKI